MDAAERDALLGVEVPNPIEGGEPYHFRPLSYKRSKHWLGLLHEAQKEGTGILLPENLDAFAAEVETVDGAKLEDLPFNPAQVAQVAVRFLAHTRPDWSPWPEANPTEAEAPPSSTS